MCTDNTTIIRAIKIHNHNVTDLFNTDQFQKNVDFRFSIFDFRFSIFFIVSPAQCRPEMIRKKLFLLVMNFTRRSQMYC